MAERPALLADLLGTCEPTLIHGDLRRNNLGLTDDRVVLVDWGERTGSAPPPVELASFLIFDGKRFDVPHDDVLADFRSLYGDGFDEKAMELALIGRLRPARVPLHAADSARRRRGARRGERRARVVDAPCRRGAGEVVTGLTQV